MTINEREIALNALLSYRRNGAWPDLYLKEALEKADSKKASLVSAITYGVLQNQNLIDYYIFCFSSLKMNKISPLVLESLRIGAYQILFLEKIPLSAAVNESVKLVSKTGNRRASGFANGLLRRLGAEKNNLPEIKAQTFEEYLSIKYSHPLWLVKKYISVFGSQEAEDILKHDNMPAMPAIRVNTLKNSCPEFEAEANKVSADILEKVSCCPDAYYVHDLGALIKSPLFERGCFYVQDVASQQAIIALNPKKGSRLLDICAAPGGKSLLACQLMENDGYILANDLYPHKAKLIKKNAEGYGAGIIHTSCFDASEYDESLSESFDYIICDVPCSGLGIIRKKPDIRFKSPDELEALTDIQKNILNTACRYLKKGGRMLYSTCTILPSENEDQVNDFLNAHPDFRLVPFNLNGREEAGYKTFLPHRDGTDGFFIALLERRHQPC